MNREMVLRWWNELSDTEKQSLFEAHDWLVVKTPNQLTGREIQMICQQFLEKTLDVSHVPIEQLHALLQERKFYAQRGQAYYVRSVNKRICKVLAV